MTTVTEAAKNVTERPVSSPAPVQALLLGGRYFRKRLREQCDLAERYGDSFGCVVITLRDPEPSEDESQSILDAVMGGLRRTDMVFPYRRRFAMILPRIRAAGLAPLIERVLVLIGVGAGPGAVESVCSIVFPHPDLPETQSVLDWAEDQLRNE